MMSGHPYVKTGVFDKELSRMIDSCYWLREKADYDDFYLVARDEAVQQLEKAEKVFQTIESYVNSL